MAGPIRTEALRDGAIERVVLARPKANVLDAEMVGALRGHLAALRARLGLRALVIEGEGPHFSFGASVAEHLPDAVEGMLRAFHGLLRDLQNVGVPTAALVRGQCLGGGLELALACGRLWCEPTAHLGLPEVGLGVFPPAGAVLLPLRVGVAEATRLVLSGRAVDGAEAARIGLADCVDDPEAAFWAWFDADLAPRSAVAVRCAWRAVRAPVHRAFADDLPAAEALYLRDLMAHRDPVEGLTAFLEKRQPAWSDR